MQEIILQLIISGSGVIISVVAVIVILARKLNNSSGNNHQKIIDTGLQKQVDIGVEGTKTLTEQYDAHLVICTERWFDHAKMEGRMDAYMVEIRDRLTKIENR